MSHQARKRFGQNFLHDANVISRIVQSISPKESDNIVEIGPGQGAITLELLKGTGQMHAVELDRDLIQPLYDAASGIGELTIHSVDALRFDFSTLATPDSPLRVVGNLPYNISTPILFHLLSQLQVIHDMHFMLQKEVVDRMAADPGSKTYGRLSIMLQARCRVIPLFDIGPGAFRPAPKVHSSFVRLVPLETPFDITDFAIFEKVVARAFSQRRKTLHNSLKGIIDQKGFELTGIDPSLRAERLSVLNFIHLAEHAIAEEPQQSQPRHSKNYGSDNAEK